MEEARDDPAVGDWLVSAALENILVFFFFTTCKFFAEVLRFAKIID